MEQDNQSQSRTQEDNPNGAAEASTAAPAPAPNTAAPATDPTAGQPPAPARPRRPQRSARVEGSVDISEPKAEPKAEPTPAATQDESATDGSAASRPKPSRPAAVKPSGERTAPSVKAGPKGPGHHPIRAASVPHPPASRPVPPHLNPHAQRALSVAGTADTQAQTMEDFRVHIITWNVGSATPPDDITSLLGLNVGDGNTDMYIIGLQEVNSMINKRLKDVLFTDQWSEVCMERLSPFGYVL
ncbi:phosphatidylinositol 4,5-bisphosphate 5-phosphatase A-like protein, partial [Lates japonicus]